jgi:hypothetical protein
MLSGGMHQLDLFDSPKLSKKKVLYRSSWRRDYQTGQDSVFKRISRDLLYLVIN